MLASFLLNSELEHARVTTIFEKRLDRATQQIVNRLLACLHGLNRAISDEKHEMEAQTFYASFETAIGISFNSLQSCNATVASRFLFAQIDSQENNLRKIDLLETLLISIEEKSMVKVETQISRPTNDGVLFLMTPTLLWTRMALEATRNLQSRGPSDQ